MIRHWRLAAFFTGLALAGPAAAQNESASLHTFVSGWEVTCSNVPHCVLFAKGKESDDAVIRVDVPAYGNGQQLVRIFTWNDRSEKELDFALSVTSKSRRIEAAGFKGIANSHRVFTIPFNQQNSGYLISHLRNGASIRVGPEGASQGKFASYPAMQSALEAASSFLKRAPVFLSAAKPAGSAIRLNNKPGEQVLALAIARCDDTESKPDEIRLGWRMPDMSILWEIFCAASGNGQSRIYIREKDGTSPQLMPLLHGKQKFGEEGIRNASFNPNTLTISSSDPGGYSCGGGSRHVFRWMGPYFRLQTWQRLDTCGLIDEAQWPHLWQAEGK